MFKVEGSHFDLHASLRAATILERRYGFQGLIAACTDGNLTVIAEIVEHSSDCPDFLKAIDGVPLASVMPELLPALNQHIQALAAIDPDNSEPTDNGETMPFKDYFARLFRIATGWLQWSPKDAWSATPKEILEAYSGHLEMLKAIYGSADDTDGSRPTDKPENAVFDREGFAQLRLMAL
jgi:hypothetical protein